MPLPHCNTTMTHILMISGSLNHTFVFYFCMAAAYNGYCTYYNQHRSSLEQFLKYHFKSMNYGLVINSYLFKFKKWGKFIVHAKLQNMYS